MSALVVRARRVVDDGRVQAGPLGMIEDQDRPELAHRGGAEALCAGDLENRLLVEVIAAEVLVDVAEHGVVFEKWRHGRLRVGHGHRVARVDRVAEVAGIARIVAGREACRIGGREGREERVRVLEVDACVAQRRHGRCRLGRHLEGAQSVRNEQDDVVGAGLLCGDRRCEKRAGECECDADHGRHGGLRGCEDGAADLPDRHDRNIIALWLTRGHL